MIFIQNSITLICFALFIYYVGRTAAKICRPSLIEWLISSFILFASSIIVTGYCLSPLHLTANVWAWALSVFIPPTIIQLIFGLLSPQTTPFSPRQMAIKRWHAAQRWYASAGVYLQFLFGVMIVSVVVIGLINLVLVLFTVPNEWDSMTGHLNRVIQYIQRGSMAHFGGTNWNIDTYPKSVCTIQIYSYLITGKFENAFKLIHHASYWITLVCIFGITQRITKNRLNASFFCALAFAMFLDFLMQAITTETDIVLAAYLSCLLYFLFTYRLTKENRYLYLAALSFGVVYGHKVTFTLLLPSVFIVMLYTVFLKSKNQDSASVSLNINWPAIFKLGTAIVICFCIWTLPTGYVKNIQVFGHPIGPPTSLKHQSIERATSNGGFRNLFEQGSRNAVRYGYDFVNLDGLRNIKIGQDINRGMRKPLVWLEDKLKMRLDETTEFSIVPFSFERRFEFFNGNPYWGIFGFALVFPLVFLVLFGIVRSPAHWFLAIALLLHFAALSYSAPYDPWKGRYFQETGVFGVLFLSLLFTHKYSLAKSGYSVALKTYVGIVTVVACISALLSVFLNVRCLPFPALGKPSAFKTERIAMMTFARPDITKAYQKFDQIVPDSATVALGTINDDFEYPLYGKHLSRRLITINPFEKGVQPIPKEADYLFFSKNVIPPLPTDLRLGTDTTMKGLIVPGEDYYLRKLK
ncbi:glycosyltransferase family 39 protein [Runella zeae]|uniref:glycosyltransferase family 39 protein n=1 Tax=Runella zeae TaxID=94255 RepID=UPI0005650FB0|nr:glycosyltransferase family 39 protein [Runella zeae]